MFQKVLRVQYGRRSTPIFQSFNKSLPMRKNAWLDLWLNCTVNQEMEKHCLTNTSTESKFPHCLKTDEQLSLVKVRCGNIQRNIPFEEISRGIYAKDTGPYFEVDNTHIIIFTTHFSQFVCSTCSKACDCIMAFPFGSLILTEDNNMTTASVTVILCPSLYNIEDFWKVSSILFLLKINIGNICLQIITICLVYVKLILIS